VYGPIGIDLGADTPQGIALAIAAEIHAVLKGRAPRHLSVGTAQIP
jgi:xanthine/CO dehydrogenase XdhC/CoxF family maturation factor